MSEPIIRKFAELTRPEWILYRWQEVTETQDTEPRFLRGIYRNPDDAQNAANNFDLMHRCYLAQKEKNDAARETL